MTLSSYDAYSAAIDILMNPGTDYRGIVIALAKEFPETLIKVASVMESNVPWKRDVDSMLRDNQVVNAIKLTREKTGLGLKDAKDYCDSRRAELGLMPFSYNPNR